MRRLVIAIDCDDVLVESTRFLVQEYNRVYHTAVVLEHAHEPNNIEWGDADERVVLDRLTELQLGDGYAGIKPSESTIAAVRMLANHHELHMITARHKNVEKITFGMVDRYFGDCFKTIEHVGKDHLKGEVCRDIGADILVDDNIRHLTSALEHGLPPGGAMHFGDYPWNRTEELPEGVIRCADWASVMSEVDRCARY